MVSEMARNLIVSPLGLNHYTEWSTAEETKRSMYFLQLLTDWGIQESVNLKKSLRLYTKMI